MAEATLADNAHMLNNFAEIAREIGMREGVFTIAGDDSGTDKIFEELKPDGRFHTIIPEANVHVSRADDHRPGVKETAASLKITDNLMHLGKELTAERTAEHCANLGERQVSIKT